MTDTGTLINVKNLTFLYGNTHALKDVSFQVDSSSITALVGPNGAGKSTLMRCLAGLSKPDNGKIFISDVDVINDPRNSHNYVSYLSDNFGIYEDLTIKETLEYFAGCYKLRKEKTSERIEEIASLLRITNKLSQKCSTLSRGWRQRAGIAVAIINNPKVLILDEPASGLDPESRSELSIILKTLHSRGVQIFVSSHILSELEEYCDSMLVLRNGVIIEHVKLHSRNSEETINAIITFARSLEEREVLFLNDLLNGVYSISNANQDLTCPVQNSPIKQHELLKSLINANLPVNVFKIENRSLENIYLNTAIKE